MKGELCQHRDPNTGAICGRTSEEHDTLPQLMTHAFEPAHDVRLSTNPTSLRLIEQERAPA
jgi:hypothetical protein